MNHSDEDAPIDLVLLTTFHEVARLGSVTQAAKQLGRSQPAISHRLRALEDELGVPLLERVGRGLRLTEYGRRLQGRCVDLMAMSAGLRGDVRQREGALEGRVTVGTFPTIAAHLLVDAATDLLTKYERVELSFVFDLLAPLLERVRRGDLDLAMIIAEAPPEDLWVESMGSLPLAAVISPKLAGRSKTSIQPAALRQHRYLSWEGPADPTFEVIQRYVVAHRLASRTTPRIPHVETLREMAVSGAGYTILPAYTAARDVARGRLVCLAPAGLRRRMQLYLVGRTRQVLTPTIAAVRARLLEVGQAL